LLDEIGQKVVGLIRDQVKLFDLTIKSARSFDEFQYYLGRLQGMETAERIVLKYFNELYEIKPVLKEIVETDE
jgi:hypothetical protein